MIKDDLSRLLGGSPGAALAKLPDEKLRQIQEVRLRLGAPLSVTSEGRTLFVTRSGGLTIMPSELNLLVTAADLASTVDKLCSHSFYAFESQINRGFIPLKGGCRAGVCGFFGGERSGSVRDITSVNIRLARQVFGCSRQVLAQIGGKPLNTVVFGAPGSGKTTVIRDMAREYSLKGLRVCAADERGELSGMGSFDLGPCCDVSTGADKAFAVNMFIKYFNPQVIVFDELADNAAEIEKCAQSGVRLLTSLHADGIEGALARLQKLGIDPQSFDCLIALGGECAGEVSGVYYTKEAQQCAFSA